MRFLVFEVLKIIDYKIIEIVVRVNGLDILFGVDDIRVVVKVGVNVVRFLKIDIFNEIIVVDKLIIEVEKEIGREGEILFMVVIESVIGIMNVKEIVFVSKRLMGIVLGVEDYVINLKILRSKYGWELYYVREVIVFVVRNVGIYCFDIVYLDVNNLDGFR